MAKRKQKGLFFFCGAKYRVGYKCVKSKLYQFLMEPVNDDEVEESQKGTKQLKNLLRLKVLLSLPLYLYMLLPVLSITQ